MPAPQRVPDSRVRSAIERWRGNVTAAADELGMKPKNLRKRLDSMGIDLDVTRGVVAPKGVRLPAPIDTHRPLSIGANPFKGVTPLPTSRALPPIGPQSHAGPYQSARHAPTLVTVTNGSASTADAAEATGVRYRRPSQPRIPPPTLDRIGQLRRRLQAELDCDLTDGDLIEMAEREGVFDAWVESKVAALRAQREGGER
jgi:hypothetical protein